MNNKPWQRLRNNQHTIMTTKDITNKFFFFHREDEEAITEAVTRIISEVKEGVDRMLSRNAHVIENREYMRTQIVHLTWIAARAKNANLSKDQKNCLANLIFDSYLH